MNASVLFRCLATLLVSLSCATAHAQRLDAVQNSALSGAGFGTSAQQQRVTVSQPNGKPWVITEDMRVKVLGGHVRFERWWTGIAWVFAPAWTNLQFDAAATGGLQSVGGGGGGGGVAAIGNQPTEFFGGTGQLGGAGAYITNASATGGVVNKITRNLADFYSDANGSTYTAFTAPRYTIRPYGPNGASITGPISVSQELIVVGPGQFRLGDARWSAPNLTTWRWEDRAGDWVEYNANGRIVRYGDRNNVTVNFRYVNDVLTAVLDHFGNEVLRFTYVAGRLTEVQDVPRAGETLPTRNVKYEYDARGSINKVIDVMGNPITYGYAADGKLTSVTDQENRTRRFEYGASNRVSKYIDADGSVSDYRYDYDRLKKQFYVRMDHPITAAGRRIEERWIDGEGELVRIDVNAKTERIYTPGSRTLSFIDLRGFETRQQKNEYDLVTSTQYPDGGSETAQYDSRHLGVLREVNEAGVITTYEYDSRGNLTRRVDAQGTADERITEFVVDPEGRITRATRKGKTIDVAGTPLVIADSAIQYGYDDRGNLTRLTDPENNVVEQLSFDRIGNPTEIKDPRASTWRIEYDAFGRTTADINPLNETVRYQYNKVGELTQITDARNKIWRYEYNALGRVTTTTDPLGNVDGTNYNAQQEPLHTEDADRVAVDTTFDTRGRLTELADGRGNRTRLAYIDPLGKDIGPRPASVRYPTYERQFRYDERNRITLDTVLQGTDGTVVGHTYDRRGRRLSSTDPNGKTMFFEYTPFDTLAKVTDRISKETRAFYDNRGNLAAIRDANNNVIRFGYDRASRNTEERDGLGRITRFEHDPNGNVTKVTDPRGFRRDYTYDRADRIAELRAYDAGNALQQTITFGYDASGNVTSWSDVNAITSATTSGTLGYDDLDRVLSESVNYGSFALSVSYTYTPGGRIRTITGPDGLTLTYNYSTHGEVESIEIPGEGTISVNDWNWSAASRMTYPGGAVKEIAHDGLLNVTGMRLRNPAQQTIAELALKYGKLFEVSEKTEDTVTARYRYDEEVRLLEAARGGNVETFSVDGNANRISHSAVAGAWTYNAADQLITRGTSSYEYDLAGNLTKRTDSSITGAAREMRFVYDAFSRLVEVRDATNALIARYVYDPFDRRLWKDVSLISPGLGGGASNRTVFFHSAEGLLAEADAAGQLTRSYGWRSDQYFGTEPLFVRTRQGANWSTGYYHHDHLGTPIRITDAGGAITWKADVNVFGQANVDGSSTVTNHLRLPGQYYDAETGLHYNWRRYYDPVTGRYATKDPIGIDGGLNQYAYGYHDPLNAFDPTGELAPLVILGGRLLLQYLACNLACHGTAAAGNLLSGGCANWKDNIVGCGTGCLLSLIPIKLPPKAACALGGANSFDGETLVHVKSDVGNDERLTTALKRIADIRAGDQVLAFAEWETIEAAMRFEKVLDVYSSQREQTLVKLTLDTGETIFATEGHPLKTTEGWRDAVLIKRGGKLLLKGEGDNKEEALVVDVQHEQRLAAVYNLEVANAHTFFVGEEGVLVHNAVHPNSRQSALPQWLYGLYDSLGTLLKCGVTSSNPSGVRNPTANDLPRPRRQIGKGKVCSGAILDSVPAGPKARSKILDKEQECVNQFARNDPQGRGPPLNVLPKPNI